MKAYFIRRLLLVPLTLLGVTFIVFGLSRLLPGGPIEQAMRRANEVSDDGRGSKGGPQGNMKIEDIEEMEEKYDYDKPFYHAYANWLGITPKSYSILKKELPADQVAVNIDGKAFILGRRSDQLIYLNEKVGDDVVDRLSEYEVELKTPEERKKDLEAKGGIVPPVLAYVATVESINSESNVTIEFSAGEETIGSKLVDDMSYQAQLVIPGSGRLIYVEVDKNSPEKVIKATYADNGEDVREDDWVVVIQSPQERREADARRSDVDVEKIKTPYDFRVKVYKTQFAGLLQGDLQVSTKYGEKVSDMILARIPISLYFGILSTIIIYGVCIPLGVVKAINHRSLMDNATSVLVFIGYSIPGFAFGALLLVYLGARMEMFPLFGLTSPNFDDLSFWSKIKDLAHHTVLPLAAYIVSGFAMMTMMMKNNLMDNLASDYVRTAVAKGVGFKRAVFKHAFRNSFIPIATSLGGLITIFVGGSLLIERVFDIQGFGLLSFSAIDNRDGPVIMGTLTISAFLMLMGNILSDVIVAFVDPRIKFK